ncbi:MAG: hypothetical protein ABI614_27955 [Planctomycetota bacterium]
MDRELGGEGFVDANAEAGLLIRPVVAVLELRTTREDVLLGA